MSTVQAERDGVGWRIARPGVYIRTLGQTMASVGGQLQKLTGNGAGQHQLRRQLGLTVGCCDTPVSRLELRTIAGGHHRPEPPVNPFYMVNGLVQMLRRWGLGAALVLSGQRLTLRRHPSPAAAGAARLAARAPSSFGRAGIASDESGYAAGDRCPGSARSDGAPRGRGGSAA